MGFNSELKGLILLPAAANEQVNQQRMGLFISFIPIHAHFYTL
jgi:hypothetical protein